MSECYLPPTVPLAPGSWSTQHCGPGPCEASLHYSYCLQTEYVHAYCSSCISQPNINSDKEGQDFWVCFLFLNPCPIERIRKKLVKKGLIKVIISGFLFNILKLRVISSCELRRPLLPILSLSTAVSNWVLEFPASLQRNLWSTRGDRNQFSYSTISVKPLQKTFFLHIFKCNLLPEQDRWKLHWPLELSFRCKRPLIALALNIWYAIACSCYCSGSSCFLSSSPAMLHAPILASCLWAVVIGASFLSLQVKENWKTPNHCWLGGSDTSITTTWMYLAGYALRDNQKSLPVHSVGSFCSVSQRWMRSLPRALIQSFKQRIDMVFLGINSDSTRFWRANFKPENPFPGDLIWGKSNADVNNAVCCRPPSDWCQAIA